MLLFTGQMVVFMAWGADQCVVQATLRVTRNYPLGHFEVRNESSFLKPTTSLGTWVLPSLLNFISKLCFNYAVIFTFASTVQVLRSFSVLITALSSLIIIREALMVYQWVGLFTVTLGLLLSAIYGLTTQDSASTAYPELNWLGILLAIVGSVCNSWRFVLEERVFRKHSVSPFLGLAYSSLVGMFLTITLLLVGEVAGLERTSETLYQLSQSPSLVASAFAYAFAAGLTAVSGLVFTKLLSAVWRTVLNLQRVVGTWLMEVALGWAALHWLNSVAIVVVVFGSVTFSSLLPIREPWWSQPVMCCSWLHMADPDSRSGLAAEEPAHSDVISPLGRSPASGSPKRQLTIRSPTHV
ncbi:MAG: hypothetical protein KVP17_003875 [Porospora cf. gigantea B]|uniref:uncharacterized protein n=1 Tax=Porospora cf. gigantea B TaxID=2853592 RepID=UPI003571CE56|nr:MAG: hypothetical protein KVP17_003875 [Porospora cf. gigantea B]